MKFVHIADVHLGAVPDSKMPWAKERKQEIWESFKNIIEVCNKESVDLLLIAGDLFHKQPLVRDLKEVNYYFSKLETARVVIMAGNHDYIGPASNYSGFEWNERVHMFLNDRVESFYFPDIHTMVHGLSYRSRDIEEPLYDYLRPPKDELIHILLAHGGDEKNIPIDRKKLSASRFDYIALGHIHKPEIISNNMAYSGSLEPLDKNETGKRGYIIGEITDGNERRTEIRFVSSSHREYKKLNITVDKETTNGALLDKITERLNTEGKQHIYQLFIEGFRDESIRFNIDTLYSLGNIIEVTDQSVPDYDFDAIYMENADNIIGMFIKKIRESEIQDEITRKALYYGMEALLEARERV